MSQISRPVLYGVVAVFLALATFGAISGFDSAAGPNRGFADTAATVTDSPDAPVRDAVPLESFSEPDAEPQPDAEAEAEAKKKAEEAKLAESQKAAEADAAPEVIAKPQTPREPPPDVLPNKPLPYNALDPAPGARGAEPDSPVLY